MRDDEGEVVVSSSGEAVGVSGRGRDEQIRARVNEATKGPWMAGCYYESRQRPTVFDVSVDPGDGRVTHGISTEADAEFIAHAREDVPYLLGRLAALETAKAWYRDHRGNGFYDEEMWGDPFAISPQLRAALAEGSAAQEETNDDN